MERSQEAPRLGLKKGLQNSAKLQGVFCKGSAGEFVECLKESPAQRPLALVARPAWDFVAPRVAPLRITLSTNSSMNSFVVVALAGDSRIAGLLRSTLLSRDHVRLSLESARADRCSTPALTTGAGRSFFSVVALCAAVTLCSPESTILSRNVDSSYRRRETHSHSLHAVHTVTLC